MLSDDLGEKKSSRKVLTFGMCASFSLRNIALKFFSLVCSSFSRNNVCKNAFAMINRADPLS